LNENIEDKGDETMSKWMLSIRTYSTTKNYIFRSRDGESTLDVYGRVKTEAKKVMDKFAGKPVTVDIISMTMAFAPKQPGPKKHLWCPYCRKYRVFVWDSKFDVDRCPVCRITYNDYWVKKYNGIFRKEYLLTMGKKEEKK
jgi:hypothetical protein